MLQKLTYTIHTLQIETNNIGISEIIKFYSFAKKYSNTSVELNISNLNNLDANLSALILAYCHKLRIERNVRVFIILAKHMNVFFRNGLISHISGKGNNNAHNDDRSSTIPLITFLTNEEESFCEYLKKEFFSHRGLDLLPITIKNQLINHFEEIFSNVIIHANTSYPIFTCGQFFPDSRVLKFTLVDLGEGFLKKISKSTNGRIKYDSEAIIWATSDLNTTKDISLYGPGGTGLKEIKKYCENHDGSLHICSGFAYVNFLKNRTLEYRLSNEFNGSMINLIFRNLK